MKITFFGVRGSIATSGEQFSRFGGNTTCLEIEAQGQRIVIDAGTGVRALGQKLLAESRSAGGAPVEATFFFTHLHWDHIQGFPFFTPAFVPTSRFDLWGPSEGGLTLEGALAKQMEAPNFPVPLAAMQSKKRFSTMTSGTTVDVGGVLVRARALCHPQGSLGYRIESNGRIFCFATDTEHLAEDTVDEALLDLAKDADVLVYDAQYTPDEYSGKVGASKKGWGHSTYTAAAKAAKAARVKCLGLFHHDPLHDDDFVAGIEAEARKVFPSTFACREGLSLTLTC